MSKKAIYWLLSFCAIFIISIASAEYKTFPLNLFGNLDDVTLDGVVNGSSLNYNSTTSEWEDFTHIEGQFVLADGVINTATSNAILIGTNDSGDYTNTVTIDGIYDSVNEVGGTPGFTIKYTFTGIQNAPRYLKWKGRYFPCNNAHDVEFQVIDQSDGSFDYFTAAGTSDISCFSGPRAGEDETVSMSFQDAADLNSNTLANYISSGQVDVIINHTSAGNTSHDFGTDYIDISHFTHMVTPGTPKVINALTADYARGATLDATNGKITLNDAKSGRCRVLADIGLIGTQDAGFSFIVYKNGAATSIIASRTMGSGSSTLGYTGINRNISCAKNDYFELYVDGDTTGGGVGLENFSFAVEAK